MSRVNNAFQLTTAEDTERVCPGHDVNLHCHLSPKTSAVVMTIRWFKGTECIYLYKNGQVTESVGYEGRVSLITPELERGNVSLRLRDFRRSDVGRYRCQVVHGEQKEEAAVGLEAASGKGSVTTVHVNIHLSNNNNQSFPVQHTATSSCS
uniref:Ig-like domain-containing protein n=1 Tax=Oncorhynchus tshawytscha TaxID=74940 RepID=A0AAZ3QAY9_ONCTS